MAASGPAWPAEPPGGRTGPAPSPSGAPPAGTISAGRRRDDARRAARGSVAAARAADSAGRCPATPARGAVAPHPRPPPGGSGIPAAAAAPPVRAGTARGPAAGASGRGGQATQSSSGPAASAAAGAPEDRPGSRARAAESPPAPASRAAPPARASIVGEVPHRMGGPLSSASHHGHRRCDEASAWRHHRSSASISSISAASRSEKAGMSLGS